MLDTILIATSGLSGHQKGLKTISDNVANMNTPGFKGSRPQFADVFLNNAGDPQNETPLPMPGGGLEILRTSTNFAVGEIRETGRDMDMAINGPGFFVVRNDRGEAFFTKSGRFEFNAAGELVTMEQGYPVMALGGANPTNVINVGSLATNPPKTTTTVTFTGNLSFNGSTSTTPSEHTISDIKVYDVMGGEHLLKLKLTGTGSAGTVTWATELTENGSALSTLGNQFRIIGNTVDSSASEITAIIVAANGLTSTVSFRLGSDVTGLTSGSTSTLAIKTSDGYPPGTPTKISFDETGVLTVTYSNGQSRKGGQLALAEFVSPDALTPATGSLFTASRQAGTRYVAAGTTSRLVAGSLELSNVDLTSQFSDLILVQRGYQASSQVLSTASEMIQDLYDMKSRR
jgi:flagellar hook protein FlgE